MAIMDAAVFYTGIVAEAYGSLKSVSQDPAPYAAFIRETGGPARELGCGDGGPLLELCRQGLEAEGVDSSADMIERCRRRAADLAAPVVLHHQRMQSLNLPRLYRAIFLAGPTFNLLPNDAEAVGALRSIRAHLASGGSALVPLFVPSATQRTR